MATIDVLNTTGETVAQAELADEIFAVAVKPSVIHQVVTAQLAARRSGSAAVKRRSDVKGSTRKLYRQKGTGRARKGDIKSPLLRGGGVVFGPSPRSFDKKVPKKVRKLALKMALSSKLQGGDLLVIDNMEMERIKTKDFVEIINALAADNALIITSAKNENLERSSRNVPNITVMRTEGLNVYDILKHRKLVLLQGSIEGIEGRLLQ
jgi:large subunit ribosomal protein L4